MRSHTVLNTPDDVAHARDPRQSPILGVRVAAARRLGDVRPYAELRRALHEELLAERRARRREVTE